MATARTLNPIERMLAATLAAGECLNDTQAPFAARWRVPMQDGAAVTFSEPTGNRLMLRGLITPHPEERGIPQPTKRFVPVLEGDRQATQVALAEVAEPRPVQKKVRRRAPTPMKQPKKSELISLLDMIGMKMADTIAHWDSGIPAEVRADLLAEIYQPTVRMLIRTGDWPRDRKRSKKAWVRESAA